VSASPQSPLALAIRDIRAYADTPSPVGPPVNVLLKQMDGFIDELECLHLSGGLRVPSTIAARLARFLRALPAECQSDFAIRTRITYVLEDLFEVQDRLLDLKVPGRTAMSAQDRARDGGEEMRRHSRGSASKAG